MRVLSILWAALVLVGSSSVGIGAAPRLAPSPSACAVPGAVPCALEPRTAEASALALAEARAIEPTLVSLEVANAPAAEPSAQKGRIGRALNRARARMANAGRALRARIVNARPLRRWFRGTTGAAGTRGTAFPKLSLTRSQRANLVGDLRARVQQAAIARAPIPSPVYLTLPLKPRGASSSGYQTLPLAPRSSGQGSYQALPGIAGYAVIPPAPVRNAYESASSPLGGSSSRGNVNAIYQPGPVLTASSGRSSSSSTSTVSSSSRAASSMGLPRPRNTYDVVSSARSSSTGSVHIKYPQGRSAVFYFYSRPVSQWSLRGLNQSASNSSGVTTVSRGVSVRYSSSVQQIQPARSTSSGTSAAPGS